jgi:hypothetical protein
LSSTPRYQDHELDGADFAGRDDRTSRDDLRHHLVLVPRHGCDRLLDQDVLPGPRRRRGDVGSDAGRRADVDRVDVVPHQERLERRVDVVVWQPQLLGRRPVRFCRIGDRHHSKIVGHRKMGGQVAAERDGAAAPTATLIGR